VGKGGLTVYKGGQKLKSDIFQNSNGLTNKEQTCRFYQIKWKTKKWHIF